MKSPQSAPVPPSFLPWAAGFALLILVVGTIRIAPPDLAFYFAWAHSLVQDVDFAFWNQYALFPFARHELYLSSEGVPANDWPMGTGVAWIPFLLFGTLYRWVAEGIGGPLTPGESIRILNWSITFGATLFYGFGTLLFSSRLCTGYGLASNARWWALAAIAAGSSLTYHLVVNSADSHPPSAFFVGLFLLLWLRWKDEPDSRIAFLAGLCIGMAAMIRPHNGLFILTPFLDALISPQPKNSPVRSVGVLAGGALLAFSPQLLAWQALYGNPLELPRSHDVHWSDPHLFEMLFSDFHGMISWSPLFGLGLLGLCLRRNTLPLLIPLLVILYIHACNIAWWAGGSFGNRRMVSYAPLFILGLAILVETIPRRWMKALIVLCGTWTLALLLAEVGGTIRLGYYMQWEDIQRALPGGIVAGVPAFVLNPEWSVHRVFIALGLALVIAAATLGARQVPRTVCPPLAGGVATLLLLVCVAATVRTASVTVPDNAEAYLPYDRFTWVVYYEKGFYHLQNHQYAPALESFLAAAMLEPGHPQPWMYIAFLADDFGRERIAYHYYRAAMEHGARSPQFLFRYEDMLNRRIRQGGENLHRLLNERGVLLTLQNEYDAAEADFRLALRFRPDYVPALTNLERIQQPPDDDRPPLLWE